MGEHLLLRGEAHLVSRGQVFGRCIHHAPLPGFPLQSAKFSIAVAVIEPPFRTVLMLPTCRSLLRGAHDDRARLRAVPSATGAASAKDQKNTAMRAASLDTELEHRKTNSEKLAAARASTILRTPLLRISRGMLAQQPEGSERLTPGLRPMGVAIVPGVASSGRISGRDRRSAGPLKVVPGRAGGSTLRLFCLPPKTPH